MYIAARALPSILGALRALHMLRTFKAGEIFLGLLSTYPYITYVTVSARSVPFAQGEFNCT